MTAPAGGCGPSDDGATTAPLSAAVGPSATVSAAPALLGRVEGVPSEQLWRAAVLAARQAAMAAAELRRALAEGAAHPSAPADGAASVTLVS